MRVACQAMAILALAVAAAPALAQSLVCEPIRRGESAKQAARRITGDSRNMYSASFQIMNGSARFIPKSQYDRAHAGWRACVIRPAARTAVSRERAVARPTDLPVAEELAARASNTPDDPPPPIDVATIEPLVRFRATAQPAASAPRRPTGKVDLTIVWMGTALAVPWFGFQILDSYATRRKTAAVLVQHFANRFIAEFERPLVHYDDAEPPLKTRVRRARRGRFEVLLAPGEGRRYPNLTDHKRNVEYDVERVMRVVGDPAFSPGALYTQDEWVVVPFTCISSS